MYHACSSANWPTVTCTAEAETSRIADVRDRETIDSELRLLAAVRRVCRDHGGPGATIGPVDELLDERLAHRCRTNENPATGCQRWPVHHAAAVKTRPGGMPTASTLFRFVADYFTRRDMRRVRHHRGHIVFPHPIRGLPV